VTYDANGGTFTDGETLKTVLATTVPIPPVKYSHTPNVNDD